MKRILLGLLVLGILSVQAIAYGPDFIEQSYVVFNSNRAPASTEPTVNLYMIPQNWLFYWMNIDTKDVYSYRGGSNGAYLWDLNITDRNINSYIPVATIGKFYLNTTPKTNVKFIAKSATVSGGAGVAVFNITDNGDSTGNALCSSVYDDTISLRINSATISYASSWVVAENKKTVTTTVNQSSGVSLLGISLLGGFVAAANGTVVKMDLMCE